MAPLRRIGMGNCGSVWADPAAQGHNLVLKREDGGLGRSLRHEHHMHLRILASLRNDAVKAGSFRSAQVNITANHTCLEASDDEAWASILPALPPDYVACNALYSERIPPMKSPARRAVIDKFCPESLREEIAADDYNSDCIMRMYMGRRRVPASERRVSRFCGFKLRNYPLHVDQMEELGLDLARYARSLAESLAFMHWCAKIDAKDIEFVLAPDRTTKAGGEGAGPTLGTGPSFNTGQLGRHVLWMLDYDCCQPMSADEAGVDQAVVAFYRNDPYYPMPGRANTADAAMWEIFSAQYVITSLDILSGASEAIQQLPRLFISEVTLRVNDFKKTPVAGG